MRKTSGMRNRNIRKSAIMTGCMRSGLIRKSGNALIMIVLMFAMLLVLGTGAVTLASSTSRRAINETKKEQAYIAARSVSMAIKDQIIKTADSAARTAYVTQLKNAVASGSTGLTISGPNTDISYELLPIETIGANLEKYTVRATYAGTSEDYSFVLLNTPETPLSDSTAFMTASKVIDMTNFIMINEPESIPSLILYGARSGNTISLKSTLNGDMFIGDNLKLETGFNLDGTLTVEGDLTLLSGIIDGDVYVKGNTSIQGGVIKGNIITDGEDFTIQGGKVEGSIFTRGKVTASGGAVEGSIYSSYNNKRNNDEHMLKISLSSIDRLYVNDTTEVKAEAAGTFAMVSQLIGAHLNLFDDFFLVHTQQLIDLGIHLDSILSVPNWAIWPESSIIDGLKTNPVVSEYDNTKNEYIIDSSGKLDISTQVNSRTNGVVIDSRTAPGNVIKLYIDTNTVISKPIRVIGEVWFYLRDNVDFKTTGSAPIIPHEAFMDQNLRTFVVGEKNHVVDIKSSFYGFIFINRPGGSGSGQIQIQEGSYPGYKKYCGLLTAPLINIHPNSGSEFFFVDPNATSGGSGGATSGYTYAGIIK